MRIAVAGGVTGGHIYPAVAVLNHFKQFEKIEVLYFATAHGLENREIVRLFPKAEILKLQVRGLKRPAFSLQNLSIAYHAFNSLRVCKEKLKSFKPDFSFITGGYVSVPLGLASHKLGIPTFIHEQNAIAGLANKVVANGAEKIFISFSESARDFKFKNAHKIRHTGNPVRKVSKKDKSVFEVYGINPNKKVVVVTGGSQGSDFINDVMLEVYQEIYKSAKNGLEFLHSGCNEAYREQFQKYPFVHSCEFIPDLHIYMAASDAAITRGGATTVAELISYGVPSIIIPWSGAAENHQLINAISLEKNEAAFYLEEREADKASLLNKLEYILDKNHSKYMRNALRILKPEYEPAERIFNEIIHSIQQRKR